MKRTSPGPNSHRQTSGRCVALRDAGAQVIVVALLLSLLTACGMYGRVIPRRAPTGIDLNRASAEAIADLPGLSEADAERIVSNRPYAAKDDLVRRGVLTEERFQAIQNRIYLSRPSAEASGPRV